jgi:hypothetical protein
MLLCSLSVAQATAFRDGVALTRFWVTGGVVKEEGTTPSLSSREVFAKYRQNKATAAARMISGARRPRDSLAVATCLARESARGTPLRCMT